MALKMLLHHICNTIFLFYGVFLIVLNHSVVGDDYYSYKAIFDGDIFEWYQPIFSLILSSLSFLDYDASRTILSLCSLLLYWIGFSRKNNKYWYFLIPIFTWYLPSLLFTHIRMGFAYALFVFIVSFRSRINYFYIFCLSLLHYSVIIFILIEFIIKGNKRGIFRFLVLFSIFFIILYNNLDLFSYDTFRVYFYNKNFNYDIIIPLFFISFLMLFIINRGIQRVFLLLLIIVGIKFLAGDELSGRLSSAILMLIFIKISYFGIINAKVNCKSICLQKKY